MLRDANGVSAGVFISISSPRSLTSIIVLGVWPLTAAKLPALSKTVSHSLVVADRWYPSSKTCSGCGSVKAKLSLAERVYQCGACGLVQEPGPANAGKPGTVARRRAAAA
jgi:Putative transposase DNA-binding domain